MNSKTRFDLKIQANFSDFVHADKVYRASKSDYPALLIMGIILLFSGGFYIVVGSLLKFESSTSIMSVGVNGNLGWLFNLSFVIGLLVVLDLYMPFFIWLEIIKNYKQITEPYTEQFTEECINMHRFNAETKFKWNKFSSAVEGRREFLLVYGNGWYISIPKKALKSSLEIDTFRDFLKTKVQVFKQRLKIFPDFPI
jgi:hypothetical protein